MMGKGDRPREDGKRVGEVGDRRQRGDEEVKRFKTKM